MKLLAVGDLHLGRRPSRLPGELAGGDQAARLGPAEAWRRLVDAALDERVDALVLAGDVVQGENDFFEAYHHLGQGVERLSKAGIPVLGVAGNHDVRVLPRLKREVAGFELLGAGGQWEKRELMSRDERLTLWGWSFPSDQCFDSPLTGRAFDRGSGVNLGLLHADRDQSTSPYAPVSSLDLERAGLDGWLLGHIHQPDPLSAERPIGYLGSVTGSNPGEPGPRGPWLWTLAAGRVEKIEQWVLAPLRWEGLKVSMEGVDEPGEIDNRLLQAVRALDDKIVRGRWQPGAVGLRVRFTGRSRLGTAAVERHSHEDRANVFTGSRGTVYFVERVLNQTRPEIPLEELAQDLDPVGLLARRLLLLAGDSAHPGRRAMIKEARASLDPFANDSRWSGLERPEPNRPKLEDEEIADYLNRAGLQMLEMLLAQKGNVP